MPTLLQCAIAQAVRGTTDFQELLAFMYDWYARNVDGN